MIKDVNEMVTCDGCFVLAHLKCFGLQQHPGDVFECKACSTRRKSKGKAKKSTFGADDSEAEEADDSSFDGSAAGDTDDEYEDATAMDEEPNDEPEGQFTDSEDSDFESGRPNRQNLTLLQAREDRLAAAEEAIYLKHLDLEAFVNEEQPDDAERHRLALLSIPVDKVWSDADLNEEKYLKLGLHLLYNKIQGKKELHFGSLSTYAIRPFPKTLSSGWRSVGA